MKKTTLLLAAGLILAACSNIGQFEEPIRKLADQWESTTTDLTRFAGQLQDQQQQYRRELNDMSLSAEVRQQLPGDTRTQLSELKTKYLNYGDRLHNLGSQLEAFLSQWQEKSEALSLLESGLVNGRLPADAPERIDRLEELLAGAEPALQEWKQQLKETTTGASAVADEYGQLLREALGEEES